MGELISEADWAAYRQIINDASDTFGQQPITWNVVTKRLAFSGDDRDPDTISHISLVGLCQYNVFKLWPNTKESDGGELDKESMAIILNKDYLRNLGYLNGDGNFNYNPEMDNFTINGEIYYPAGDTQVSQAFDDPLHIYIILKRTPTPTGQTVY
jgi:hypothetical protein